MYCLVHASTTTLNRDVAGTTGALRDHECSPECNPKRCRLQFRALDNSGQGQDQRSREGHPEAHTGPLFWLVCLAFLCKCASLLLLFSCRDFPCTLSSWARTIHLRTRSSRDGETPSLCAPSCTQAGRWTTVAWCTFHQGAAGRTRTQWRCWRTRWMRRFHARASFERIGTRRIGQRCPCFVHVRQF